MVDVLQQKHGLSPGLMFSDKPKNAESSSGKGGAPLVNERKSGGELQSAREEAVLPCFETIG
jgi:hypothetical protein